MEILDKINWTFEQDRIDVNTLTGSLTTQFYIDISKEQYYYVDGDKRNAIYELAKKNIRRSISNIVFNEVIDMLKSEGTTMIRESFKCNDPRDSELIRECARKLLLMVSKMECPE